MKKERRFFVFAKSLMKQNSIKRTSLKDMMDPIISNIQTCEWYLSRNTNTSPFISFRSNDTTDVKGYIHPKIDLYLILLTVSHPLLHAINETD